MTYAPVKENYWLRLLAKAKKKKKIGLEIYHPLVSLGVAFPPSFDASSDLLELSLKWH